ncbi:cadherin [Clonorchis sinensis]|uniref:Cadherin n=1 Tax=Clonorchis sinensis TaxID=79923 RepID=G7YLV7_CLOSI|nr:cadherin [Clonorchis sinensis]
MGLKFIDACGGKYRLDEINRNRSVHSSRNFDAFSILAVTLCVFMYLQPSTSSKVGLSQGGHDGNPTTNGRPLLQVEATDADSGDNGRITYRIGAGNSAGFFTLDNATGILMISPKVAVDQQNTQAGSSTQTHIAEPPTMTNREYRLLFEACDHGVPKRCATPIWVRLLLDVDEMSNLVSRDHLSAHMTNEYIYPESLGPLTSSGNKLKEDGSQNVAGAKMVQAGGALPDNSRIKYSEGRAWSSGSRNPIDGYYRSDGLSRDQMDKYNWNMDGVIPNRRVYVDGDGRSLREFNHAPTSLVVSEAVIICLVVVFIVLLCAAGILFYLVRRKSILYTVGARVKSTDPNHQVPVAKATDSNVVSFHSQTGGERLETDKSSSVYRVTQNLHPDEGKTTNMTATNSSNLTGTQGTPADVMSTLSYSVRLLSAILGCWFESAVGRVLLTSKVDPYRVLRVHYGLTFAFAIILRNPCSLLRVEFTGWLVSVLSYFGYRNGFPCCSRSSIFTISDGTVCLPLPLNILPPHIVHRYPHILTIGSISYGDAFSCVHIRPCIVICSPHWSAMLFINGPGQSFESIDRKADMANPVFPQLWCKLADTRQSLIASITPKLEAQRTYLRRMFLSLSSGNWKKKSEDSNQQCQVHCARVHHGLYIYREDDANCEEGVCFRHLKSKQISGPLGRSHSNVNTAYVLEKIKAVAVAVFLTSYEKKVTLEVPRFTVFIDTLRLFSYERKRLHALLRRNSEPLLDQASNSSRLASLNESIYMSRAFMPSNFAQPVENTTNNGLCPGLARKSIPQSPLAKVVTRSITPFWELTSGTDNRVNGCAEQPGMMTESTLWKPVNPNSSNTVYHMGPQVFSNRLPLHSPPEETRYPCEKLTNAASYLGVSPPARQAGFHLRGDSLPVYAEQLSPRMSTSGKWSAFHPALEHQPYQELANLTATLRRHNYPTRSIHTWLPQDKVFSNTLRSSSNAYGPLHPSQYVLTPRFHYANAQLNSTIGRPTSPSVNPSNPVQFYRPPSVLSRCDNGCEAGERSENEDVKLSSRDFDYQMPDKNDCISPTDISKRKRARVLLADFAECDQVVGTIDNGAEQQEQHDLENPTFVESIDSPSHKVNSPSYSRAKYVYDAYREASFV